MWTPPSITDFKAYFARDFNYAPTGDESNLAFVTDGDLTKARNLAIIGLNQNLGDDDWKTAAFLYLMAYYLVNSIQTSTQGLSSQSNFPVSSKSAGPLSVTYSVPERYTKDPFVQPYTMNGYGMQYLQLALPRIIGMVQVTGGTTTVG